MYTEEFSFPRVSRESLNLTGTQSLWRIAVDNTELELENGKKKRVGNRSFSDMYEAVDAAEEKMDMLWEDLNKDDNTIGYYSDFDEYSISRAASIRHVHPHDDYVDVQVTKVDEDQQRVNVSCVSPARMRKQMGLRAVLKKLRFLHKMASLKTPTKISGERIQR